MKGKDNIIQERLRKLTRLGIGLAAVTTLGGLVATTVPLLGSVVVEAQEVSDQTGTDPVSPASQSSKTVTFVTNYHDDYGSTSSTKQVTLYPGGSYAFEFYEQDYIPSKGQPQSYTYDELIDGTLYSLDLYKNSSPSITPFSKTVTFTIQVAGENNPLSYQVTLTQGQVYQAFSHEGRYAPVDGQKRTYSFDEIEDGGVYNLHATRTEGAADLSAKEVAKTVHFVSYDDSHEVLTDEKVTLFAGERYTFAFNPATHILPASEKVTYTYDEVSNDGHVGLNLTKKAQTHADQSVSFEVITKANFFEGGGVGDYPIEHKVFTLQLGESITLTPPVYEVFELNKADHALETITNDGKTAIKGLYTFSYRQKKSLLAPTVQTDAGVGTLPAVDRLTSLKVVHTINDSFRDLMYYSVPANGSVSPLQLVNPNYGQLLRYELTDFYGINNESRQLTFYYQYPKDRLPKNATNRLPLTSGVWQASVLSTPNPPTADRPTLPAPTPITDSPTLPGIQPKEPALADKQIEDLTAENSAVSVRVFGRDVATVDKIVANKETNPIVLAALPAVYPAQNADLYDIKTLDQTGQFVQIGGEAQVTLPVASGRLVEKVIYFLPSTGAVEELPFVWNKTANTVSFIVSHFSYYGLIYQSINNPSPVVIVDQVTPGSHDGSASPQLALTALRQNRFLGPAAQSATSQALPKAGEKSSLLPVVGLGLAGLALVCRPRRQQR